MWMHLALSPIQVVSVHNNVRSTVLESVKAHHKVTTGFVCCSIKDIKCIDGVCDDGKKHWTIEVNGDYTHYNSMSEVFPSDKVVLKYASLREK